jgi:hypothetical protein
MHVVVVMVMMSVMTVVMVMAVVVVTVMMVMPMMMVRHRGGCQGDHRRGHKAQGDRRREQAFLKHY